MSDRKEKMNDVFIEPNIQINSYQVEKDIYKSLSKLKELVGSKYTKDVAQIFKPHLDRLNKSRGK